MFSNLINTERRRGNKIILVWKNGARVEAATAVDTNGNLTKEISPGVLNYNVNRNMDGMAPVEKDTPEQTDNEEEKKKCLKTNRLCLK